MTDRTYGGMTNRAERQAWVRAHEDTTEREALGRLMVARAEGKPVAPSTLALAHAAAGAEDGEQGLRSGRLVACPNCGRTVAPGALMSSARGPCCPACFDDANDG